MRGENGGGFAIFDPRLLPAGTGFRSPLRACEDKFTIGDLLKSSKNGSSVANPKNMVPRQKASGATIGDPPFAVSTKLTSRVSNRGEVEASKACGFL